MGLTEKQAREFLKGPSFKTKDEALAYLREKDETDTTFSEMFASGIEQFAAPHKLAARQIGNLIGEGISKAAPVMDLPVVPAGFGLGNAPEMITPRTALTRVEPLLSTLEVVPETIKQTLRNVVLPLQGKKEFDAGEIFRGLRIVGRRGSVFGELTKPGIGKEGQFSFLPEILKEMDLPEGIELPGIGVVPMRGVAGLVGEMLLPSLPGFGIAKARRVASIVEKGAKATKAEVRFAREGLQEIDNLVTSLGREQLEKAGKVAREISESKLPKPPGAKVKQVDDFLAEFDKPQQQMIKATLPTKARDEFVPFKISARKAYIAESRKVLGLDQIPNPERKSWETTLSNAKAKKLNEKALRIADDVLEKPRALSDEETAGLTLKRAELMNEHKQAYREMAGTNDPAEIKLRGAEIARIEDEFERVDRAIRSTGTEQGRALASRKMTINQDYSLVAVKTRAKSLAGKPLTKKQQNAFNELVRRLEDQSRKVDELERFVMETEATTIVKSKGQRYRKMAPKQREVEISSLAERAKRLIASGCNISG